MGLEHDDPAIDRGHGLVEISARDRTDESATGRIVDSDDAALVVDGVVAMPGRDQPSAIARERHGAGLADPGGRPEDGGQHVVPDRLAGGGVPHPDHAVVVPGRDPIARWGPCGGSHPCRGHRVVMDQSPAGPDIVEADCIAREDREDCAIRRERGPVLAAAGGRDPTLGPARRRSRESESRRGRPRRCDDHLSTGSQRRSSGPRRRRILARARPVSMSQKRTSERLTSAGPYGILVSPIGSNRYPADMMRPPVRRHGGAVQDVSPHPPALDVPPLDPPHELPARKPPDEDRGLQGRSRDQSAAIGRERQADDGRAGLEEIPLGGVETGRSVSPAGFPGGARQSLDQPHAYGAITAAAGEQAGIGRKRHGVDSPIVEPGAVEQPMAGQIP